MDLIEAYSHFGSLCRQEKLNSTEKLILLELLFRWDGKNWIESSCKDLGVNPNVNRVTVQKTIASLEEKGVIRVSASSCYKNRKRYLPVVSLCLIEESSCFSGGASGQSEASQLTGSTCITDEQMSTDNLRINDSQCSTSDSSCINGDANDLCTSHSNNNYKNKSLKNIRESENPKSEASKRKPAKRKMATPLPDDFSLTDQMRRWYEAHDDFHMPIEQATEEWLEYVICEGKKYHNWTCAWQKGVRQQNRHNKKYLKNYGQQTHQQVHAEAARQFEQNYFTSEQRNQEIDLLEVKDEL